MAGRSRSKNGVASASPMDPAIHVFPAWKPPRRGCPGHRRAEATPSFGRLCPGM